MKLVSRAATVLAATALTASVGLAAAGSASAETIGTGEGCTPGYWKNHTESWQEISPSQTTASLFSQATKYGLGTQTTLQALQGGGGKGDAGAASILLRAATASALNAAYDPLQFPLIRNPRPGYTGVLIISATNAALASGDRQQMLDLAAYFDGLNNAGCPLT